MPAYIVTYDLNREVVRPPLLKAIKAAYPAWAKLSESSYVVSTDSNATQVFNRLKPLIDNNDNLFVIPVSKPYDGYGPKAVIEWLNDNLPR